MLSGCHHSIRGGGGTQGAWGSWVSPRCDGSLCLRWGLGVILDAPSSLHGPPFYEIHYQHLLISKQNLKYICFPSSPGSPYGSSPRNPLPGLLQQLTSMLDCFLLAAGWKLQPEISVSRHIPGGMHRNIQSHTICNSKHLEDKYYIVVKMNVLQLHVATYMNLKNIYNIEQNKQEVEEYIIIFKWNSNNMKN